MIIKNIDLLYSAYTKQKNQIKSQIVYLYKQMKKVGAVIAQNTSTIA
jgi:hypothetical protein